jgi:hypothetical protein
MEADVTGLVLQLGAALVVRLCAPRKMELVSDKQ